MSRPSRIIRRSAPTSIFRLSTTALTPKPGTASKFSISQGTRPRRSAARTIASATGCSERASTEPTSRSTSASTKPSATTKSVSSGRPSVSVPVLSRAMTVASRSVCRASPLRKSTPSSAARPVPTMIEVGVARPMAHGQAMISTATALTSAKDNAGSGPSTSHAPKVSKAAAMTAGTNHAVTLSTNAWIGSFEPWAASTMRMIWASSVAEPTLVARNEKLPVLLMVPPTTSAPIPLDTGSGSPVIMDSSMKDDPSTISPSTAIFSPGRTTTTSPTRTSASGTSTVTPFLTTRAVLGCSPTSFLIASLVRPLARASR